MTLQSTFPLVSLIAVYEKLLRLDSPFLKLRRNKTCNPIFKSMKF